MIENHVIPSYREMNSINLGYKQPIIFFFVIGN